MAHERFFASTPATYDEPAGDPPDGMIWDAARGRYVTVQQGIKAPLINAGREFGAFLVAVASLAGHPEAIVPLTTWEQTFENAVNNTPDSWFSDSVINSGDNVLMFAPHPGHSVGRRVALGESGAVSGSTAAQLDAVIRGLYCFGAGDDKPFPVLDAVASLLGCVAGSMQPRTGPNAWSPLVMNDVPYDEVYLYRVLAHWLEVGTDEANGVALRRGELVTALAEKLKPHLDATVTHLGEPAIEHLFGLLLAVVNIVGSRYELTSRPGPGG